MSIPTTYVISGANGLYVDALRQVMTQYIPGSQEVAIEDAGGRIGFMYQVQTGLAYDRRAYRVQAWIKSLLGDAKRAITDKSSLFREMERIGYASYLAPTRDLATVSTISPGEILIAKPTGDYTGGGRGNLILTTTAELMAAKREYAQKKLNGIASTYINNPWLHNGRKMHLRMYFLVRAASSELGVSYFYELWNRGKINTALLPYVQADYGNPQIHDSHMKSTAADYNFPEDLQIPAELQSSTQITRESIIQSIFEQMVAAMTGVGMIMQSHSNILPEARYGFEVFGIDFLVATENAQPRVYLLECNTRVAYGSVQGEKDAIKAQTGIDFTPERGPWTESYQIFSRYYFEWMFVHGIAPFYLASQQHPQPITQASTSQIPTPSTVRKYIPKKTFLISGGTGLKHKYLRDILIGNGFQELTVNDLAIGSHGAAVGSRSSVGYLQIEKLCDDLASYDKRVVSLPCDIKSILSDAKRIIANKELLHLTMFQDYPDIAAQGFAPTWKAEHVPMSEKNKILILRPIGEGASCGRGIYMSTTPVEFEQARQNILKEGAAIRLKSIIASEYILNPLLLGRKKFHIRAFFLVRTGPDYAEPFVTDLWPRGRIVTAELPYERGNWHNKKIHDTHSESTPYNMWFPEDLPEPSRASEIYQKMQLTLSAVADLLQRNRVGPYPESRNAFEVFGCDFLVTDDYQVILIEINDRVGYRDLGEPPTYTLTPQSQHWYLDGKYTFDNFSQDYFTWLFYLVLAPLFSPHEPHNIGHLCGFGIDRTLLNPLYEAQTSTQAQTPAGSPTLTPVVSTSLQYTFAAPADKAYLQTFIDQIKTQPRTVESMLAISPRAIHTHLLEKFPDPSITWPAVMKELVSILIGEALPYVPSDAVTSHAIGMSFDTLYGKDKKIVPALILPTVQVATLRSLIRPIPSMDFYSTFGHWDVTLLEQIITLRHLVWTAAGIPMKNVGRDAWTDDQDLYGMHVGIGSQGQLVAATRLGVFANWEEIPGSWWFNNLTEPVPGPVLTISRLVVSPTIQKQGLGRTLDTLAIETARMLGCKSVFCDVPPYRVEPLKRMGFRQIREPKVSRNFPTLTWTAMLYSL